MFVREVSLLAGAWQNHFRLDCRSVAFRKENMTLDWLLFQVSWQKRCRYSHMTSNIPSWSHDVNVRDWSKSEITFPVYLNSSAKTKHEGAYQCCWRHHCIEVPPAPCWHQTGGIYPGLWQQHVLQTIYPATRGWTTLWDWDRYCLYF